MNKISRWILIHNPNGLTGFLIMWVIGGSYWLISLVGLVSPVDHWIMFKVLASCSSFAFIFFPAWNFIFGKTF